MKFLTESQSIYQVDYDNMQIRRLSGITPHQNDGVFKTYGYISEIEVGNRAVVLFESEDQESGLRMMRTSKVVQLEN